MSPDGLLMILHRENSNETVFALRYAHPELHHLENYLCQAMKQKKGRLDP